MMKLRLQQMSFLVLLVIANIFCSKHPEVIGGPGPNPPAPAPPTGMLRGDKEFFFGRTWEKTSSGFEMKLATSMLTDSAIRRGIDVYVAIYWDWSPYNKLPVTLNDIDLPDTVNLRYDAMPGKLQVFAKAPFNINWASDVFIQYR